MAMQSTEGKGQRDTDWDRRHDAYKAYLEKYPGDRDNWRVFYAGCEAEAYSQSGAGPRDWREMCTVEIAAENLSVAQFVDHWEERAIGAEKVIEAVAEYLKRKNVGNYGKLKTAYDTYIHRGIPQEEAPSCICWGCTNGQPCDNPGALGHDRLSGVGSPEETCGVQSSDKFVCNLKKGHEGRHEEWSRNCLGELEGHWAQVENAASQQLAHHRLADNNARDRGAASSSQSAEPTDSRRLSRGQPN